MTDIACRSGVELLMEYLEGVLPPELCAALDEHVAGCLRCAAFVESYRNTPRIVREAMGTPALPPDIEASLRAFLRARTTAFRSR
jgi:anti-sigma factor RsiW